MSIPEDTYPDLCACVHVCMYVCKPSLSSKPFKSVARSSPSNIDRELAMPGECMSEH